jgi:hypothetical protein
MSYCREGEFKDGKMHGIGYYTVNNIREEALMRDNKLLCLKKGISD